MIIIEWKNCLELKLFWLIFQNLRGNWEMPTKTDFRRWDETMVLDRRRRWRRLRQESDAAVFLLQFTPSQVCQSETNKKMDSLLLLILQLWNHVKDIWIPSILILWAGHQFECRHSWVIHVIARYQGFRCGGTEVHLHPMMIRSWFFEFFRTPANLLWKLQTWNFWLNELWQRVSAKWAACLWLPMREVKAIWLPSDVKYDLQWEKGLDKEVERRQRDGEKRQRSSQFSLSQGLSPFEI